MSYQTQIFIAIATCFFSFGIQTLFFLIFKIQGSDLIKKEKTVFNYLSGVIGDGILVPLTNIFAIQTWRYTGATFIGFIDINTLIVALPIGFAITYISHRCQERSLLTNWTMPKIGHWNTLGLYHALFMFWETSFLGYVLISQIKFSILYGPQSFLHSPIKYGFLALALFLLTFFVDYWKTLFGETFHSRITQLFNFNSAE